MNKNPDLKYVVKVLETSLGHKSRCFGNFLCMRSPRPGSCLLREHVDKSSQQCELAGEKESTRE